MNAEKIFKALENDETNSALGIITAELENQGYKLKIEDIESTAEDIFSNKLPSLEEVTTPLNFKLFKDGKEEQKFAIEFIDYHRIVIKKFTKN